MSEHVYTENTKPDRPGIWWQKGLPHPYAATDKNLTERGWSTGSWCRIGDLPDIKDPPKYRDVTPADVGRDDVEFSDNGVEWGKCQLRAVSPLNDEGCRFFSRSCGWNHARILDDGQPAKQPREFYIEVTPTEYLHGYKTKIKTSNELIHVREVID